MGLLKKIKGEFIDIIEWLDPTNDTIVHRFERHQNEIKMGAKLTVRESQVGVFINEGQIADVFEPGMHSLTTENMPILSTLKGWKYGFNSPFKAEVYFVNTKKFTDNKWGTPNPIMLRDPEFGPIRIRAFGNYEFRVKDATTFIKDIVGTDGSFTKDEVTDQLRNIILTRFTDAIGEAKKVVLEAGLNKRFDEEELNDIATKVGIAAIKFADLSNQRMSNYIFDLERFTKFEGKTGPYQMYAAVRIKSMLRKAKEQGLKEGSFILTADAERNLMLALAALPEAVLGAAAKNAPHILCEHVYSLTQEFNAFYHDCHVLGEENEAVRSSRLKLCALTLKQIETVLNILGIDVPERM